MGIPVPNPPFPKATPAFAERRAVTSHSRITKLGTVEQSPLRDSDFRVFAAGNVINNLGETAFVGIGPVIIVQLTGRDAVPAFVVSVALASLLSPVIGSLVDRWDWRAPFLVRVLRPDRTITGLVFSL